MHRWPGATTNTYDIRLVPATGGADPLAASARGAPSYTLTTLTGEWDTTGCDQLDGVLAAQVQGGARNLIVDLSDVALLDSACLYVLLKRARMAERSGGTLQLASPQPVVVRLMSLLAADRLIAVRASVAEATAGSAPCIRVPGKADKG
jgi:anti-anti-sigma factor